MNRTIAALTQATAPSFPGFVNISETAEGVAITLRAAPEVFDGVRVCGQDCVPGFKECNGYCRGQAPRAEAMTHVRTGTTNRLVLTHAEWAEVRAAIIADMGRVDSGTGAE